MAHTHTHAHTHTTRYTHPCTCTCKHTRKAHTHTHVWGMMGSGKWVRGHLLEQMAYTASLHPFQLHVSTVVQCKCSTSHVMMGVYMLAVRLSSCTAPYCSSWHLVLSTPSLRQHMHACTLLHVLVSSSAATAYMYMYNVHVTCIHVYNIIHCICTHLQS